MSGRQSGLGRKELWENPVRKMFGIYSGVVTGYVKSKDLKIIGLQVRLEIHGMVPFVILTRAVSGGFAPPQMKEKVLIQFIDGDMNQPVLMAGLYPFTPAAYGSEPKEAFLKLPNGVTILSDKDGNITINTTGTIEIQSPTATQNVARKGDKTLGHTHTLPAGSVNCGGYTNASPITVPSATDTINEGSASVKVGD